MTIADTARSLLHFFGTFAEWGAHGLTSEHEPSDALRALIGAVLEIVPAAWTPTTSATDGTGSVTLYAPNPNNLDGQIASSVGCYYRGMVVFNIAMPARWVAPERGTLPDTDVRQATVAALVGLASVKVDGCARALDHWTEDDIAYAELGGGG